MYEMFLLTDCRHCGMFDNRNAKKRSSRSYEDYRELSVGARQSRKRFELASEQPVERLVDTDGA